MVFYNMYWPGDKIADFSPSYGWVDFGEPFRRPTQKKHPGGFNNAAKYCKEQNIPLITLSGFKDDNPLSQLGNVNIHVNSDIYNFIEMSHHIILLSIVDIFAQKLA